MNNVVTMVGQSSASRVLATLSHIEADVWSVLASKSKNTRNLAELHDCSEQTIRNIKQLKTDRAARIAALMNSHGVVVYSWPVAFRFSEEQVAGIRSSTETSAKVAARWAVSPSTIRMIRTGKTYNG